VTNNALERMTISTTILLSTVVLMLTGEAAVSAQAPSGIFVAGQHLSYKGYHIIVSHTRNGDRSIISVRRGARILIRWSNRDGPINDDMSSMWCCVTSMPE
jgi:hypothetical protein